MKPILLIKTGETIPDIKPQFGDFEDWFAPAMGVSGFLQVDVLKQQELPSTVDIDRQIAGIVITGSAAMVSAQLDWSEYAADWLRRVVPAGVPLLGVCYGHQLLAHALGGQVGPNPNGRQMGTVEVQLCAGATHDPLLGRLPQRFSAQASHTECVLEIAPGAQRLAVSPRDTNFALRFAQNVWGLQFHPEFSRQVMVRYIQLRSKALQQEGFNQEQLQAQTSNTSQARSVLRNFANLTLHRGTAADPISAGQPPL